MKCTPPLALAHSRGWLVALGRIKLLSISGCSFSGGDVAKGELSCPRDCSESGYVERGQQLTKSVASAPVLLGALYRIQLS